MPSPSVSDFVYAALLYHGDSPEEEKFEPGTITTDADGNTGLVFSFQRPDKTSGLTLEIFAFSAGTTTFSRAGALLSGKGTELSVTGDKIEVTEPIALLSSKQGSVSLKITVPAGCSLEIDETTDSGALFAVTGTSPNYTLTQKDENGISAGSYQVNFTVKKGGQIVYTFTESINVLNGLRTDTWSGQEKGEAKEITQSAISSTVFVRGESAPWYASNAPGATASDENSGTYLAPFETIQKAVDKIIAINDGADEYTIYVDGTLKYDDSTYIGTNGMADFSALTENLTLTIKALSGTATLDGGAQFDADGNVTDAGIGKSVIYAAPASGTLNLTLDNLVITGGNTSKNGGGIYIGGGKFEMTGGKILKNISSRSGGGVYISKGTFDMEGGTISENTANQNGGGVYVATGTFSMKGGTISGNNAENGCGVYVDSGTFDMEGGTISGNNAPSYGGGVFVCNGTFTFTGGTISKCTARRGGGVSVYNGIFTMLGGTIGSETAGDANTASWGGGVYVEGGSTFTMTGGAISGNSATNDGNGAYLSATGTFNMSGSAQFAESDDVYLDALGSNIATITVAGNLTATSPVATITPSAYTAGTPVLTKGAGVTDTMQAICDKFALTPDPNGVEWKIAPDGTAGVLKTTTVYVSSTGSDTNSGDRLHPFATIQKAVDTVIANNDGASEYTIYIDGTLDGTTAAYLGASGMADFSALTKKLTLTMKALSGTATLDGGARFDGNGNVTSEGIRKSVIYMSGSFNLDKFLNLTLENLVITGGNTTSNGGGIEFNRGGTLTMKGCTISGNKAANGGGIHLGQRDTLIMEGCTVSKNKVIGYGGGVYVVASTFTMNGGTITGNTATNDGGGVYVNSNGTFTMSGGTIIGNTATNGGGVYIYSGAFTMENGTVSNNTAPHGGGVYIYSTSGKFIMNAGEITGNEADDGGGVYKNGGTFTQNGGTISGNTPSDVAP